VFSEKWIRDRFKNFKILLNSEYENNRIHYAVKANSNLSILKILHSEGAFFDCTSMGEIYTCFKAGISPERIIYTGNMFTDEDLKFAVENKVLVNLDSVSQLKRLTRIHDDLGEKKGLISFRINPEFGAGHHAHTITAGKTIKFGILEDQAIEAFRKAKESGFEKFGVHQHIGSGVLNAQDFKKPVEKYISIIKKIANSLEIEFEFIDFGGGLGIPYRPSEELLNFNIYKDVVIKPFKKLINSEEIGKPIFKIEPGRFLTAESSILLTQINTIKNNGYKLFAGVDAGFNTLLRPTLYGAYHHIIACNKNDGQPTLNYDVTGPICESGDILGKDREFNILEEKDFKLIPTVNRALFFTELIQLSFSLS